MEITTEDINQYVYDPTSVQKLILEELDTASTGSYSIVDLNNPFVIALETAVTCAAAAVHETANQIRKQYPSLATTEDDLYHHITENESTYIFSYPAEVTVTLYVNVLDIKNNGVEASDKSYKEITIPSGTSITALGTPLLLLNDVLVRVYSNNEIFVEQQLDNNNDIAYDDVSIIDSKLVTDSGNVSWVTFSLKLKQLKKYTINKAISKSAGFSQVVTLENKFCHANVYYKNSSNNLWIPIEKMFNDEYIDPYSPSVVVKVYGSSVLFKIPDQYIVENMISGNVKIEVYDTIGKLYLPMNQYLTEDFSLDLGDTGKSSQAAAAKNVAIMVSGKTVLDGGSNAMTIGELRQTIINNTTGDIDLPITEKQIEQYGNINGYTIIKNLDIITEREFLGLKSIPEVSTNLISAHHTIFFNTAKLTLSEIENHKNIIINANSFVIKSNTLFKNNNGTLTIVNNDDLELMEKMNNYVLIEYLKNNKIFYNPFYYLIEKNESFVNSRVYDLDNPVINYIRIKEKNITLNQRANIDKYTIKRTDSGYRLWLTLSTNESFDKLEKKNILIQMKVPLYNGTNYAYINSSYDSQKEAYYLDIESNLNITDDNTIDLQNGTSTLFTKYFNLETDIEIFICSTEYTLIDPTSFLKSEVNISAYNYVVYTKELINIKFGTELVYIYNNLYNTYSERKYKRYTEDVPLVYDADVYEVNPDTGCIATVSSMGGKDIITYNILHKAGDQVFNEDGSIAYKYRKGDSILDENGNPIVDLECGVVRYVDILMIEYEFLASTSNAYQNYNSITIENLKNFILNELSTINNKLLEKTTIKYRSFNTVNSIAVSNNNNTSYINNNCSPSVVLYIQNTTTIDNNTKETYKTIIGTILNNYFASTKIVLENIKTEIKNKLGSNVSGVKITGIDIGNSEIINIKDTTNRFYLNKLLALNKNNETIVKYDIDLDIVYI